MYNVYTYGVFLCQIQIFAFVLHTGYNLVTDCDFLQTFNIAVFLYAISLIVLFGNFYYKAYYLKQ